MAPLRPRFAHARSRTGSVAGPFWSVHTQAKDVPSIGAMLAPTFGWLLVCRVGQGVLAGGNCAVALAYIADEFPRPLIGTAVGA
jgi:MFS family permease